MTYATKQDGSRNIVNASNSCLEPNIKENFYTAKDKTEKEIQSYFSISSIGEKSLDAIIKDCKYLPACVAFIDGSRGRDIIIRCIISDAIRNYINRSY